MLESLTCIQIKIDENHTGLLPDKSLPQAFPYP